MRRVCFLAALVFFASLNWSAEVAACPVKFRHEHRCHYHPVVPKGESLVEKAKHEAQKIIDDAKHEADDIKAKATSDANIIKADAKRDADDLRASAKREADNTMTNANLEAAKIKASAASEKTAADNLMAAAVATQKAAADQIEQASRSKQESDKQAQEFRDKSRDADAAKHKADDAQEAFGQAKRDWEEAKKEQMARFERIITKVKEPDVIFVPNPAVPPPGIPLCCGDPGKAAGNCCQTKEP